MTHAVFDFASIGASIRKASSLKTEPNTVHAKVYVPPGFTGGSALYGNDTVSVSSGTGSVFWSAADGCYLPIE